jgi:hypothetical protein
LLTRKIAGLDRSELAEFLARGPAMLGASADASRVPSAFRVWGASIDGAGRLRALVSCDASLTIGSVQAGVRLAFVVTDIVTYESVQLKGQAVSSAEPPNALDIQVTRDYTEAFTKAAAGVGLPRELVESLRPISLAVITITIERMYDQTPGPRSDADVRGERG